MNWSNNDSLYKLAAKYFHTENVANSDALNYTGETHWFSKNPVEKALWAHEESVLADYMNGNYTWINLCDNTADYIDDIKIDEIKTNTRIAALTYNQDKDISIPGFFPPIQHHY